MYNLKKNIILKKGQEPKAMNYEEVVNQFKPLISKFATKCVNMSSTQEKDDYIQIAMLKIYECFSEYDEVHVFTTRLMLKLKGEVSIIAAYDLAAKRDSGYITSSLDAMNETEDGISQKETIGDLDMEIETLCENEVIAEIFENLTDDEKEMYIHIIDGGMSVKKFAESKGRSRQAMNYTYRKFTSKLHKLYIQAVTC